MHGYFITEREQREQRWREEDEEVTGMNVIVLIGNGGLYCLKLCMLL